MSALWTITKREFRSYFDSPLAYVVICLSAFGLGLMFFMYQGGFWQMDRATMQQLFGLVPAGLSYLIVPVVTMRLMAEERRSGTLEMLITLPVKDSDVILGKYFGALALVFTVVLASLAYPIMMFLWPWSLGPLDMGPVVSGYVGLLLFAATTVAIGLLISSLSESQAVAFFITFFILGAFWLSGDLAEHLTYEKDDLINWAAVVNYVSFKSRMEGFMRGLIDSRDVIYFLSVTVLSLMTSFRALERRKWA